MEDKNKIEVKVDFKLVWGIMWRWLVLVFGFYIVLIILVLAFSALIS